MSTTNPPRDDSATSVGLLDRLADASDRTAWEAVNRKYGPRIVRMCVRRGIQTTDAEDIRQAVLLGMSQSMRGFRYDTSRGRFRDYISRATRNQIARYLDSSRRRRESDGGAGPEAMAPYDDSKGASAIHQVDPLSEHCRAAARELRTYESRRNVQIFDLLLAGQNATQIAAALGMTPAAVRKAAQRMRDSLRTSVQRRCDRDAGKGE